MAYMHFIDEYGAAQVVGVENPMPTSGADPGLDQLNAQAPVTYDQASYTVGVTVGTAAGEVAAGDHTHTEYAQSADLAPVATSGSYVDLTEKPVYELPVAAYVDPATGTVADVINSLIQAGLMEQAPA